MKSAKCTLCIVTVNYVEVAGVEAEGSTLYEKIFPEGGWLSCSSAQGFSAPGASCSRVPLSMHENQSISLSLSHLAPTLIVSSGQGTLKAAGRRLDARHDVELSRENQAGVVVQH